MTNEATRLAEEARNAARLASETFYAHIAADHLAAMDAAIDALAALAQPAVSEDAPEFTHEPALCIKPACPPNCCGCNHAISGQEQRDYAIRYALLRRKVCIIGAFGKDAAFHILNLDPVADWKNDAASTILDKAIDAAMASQEKPHD